MNTPFLQNISGRFFLKKARSQMLDLVLRTPPHAVEYWKALEQRKTLTQNG